MASPPSSPGDKKKDPHELTQEFIKGARLLRERPGGGGVSPRGLPTGPPPKFAAPLNHATTPISAPPLPASRPPPKVPSYPFTSPSRNDDVTVGPSPTTASGPRPPPLARTPTRHCFPYVSDDSASGVGFQNDVSSHHPSPKSEKQKSQQEGPFMETQREPSRGRETPHRDSIDDATIKAIRAHYETISSSESKTPEKKKAVDNGCEVTGPETIQDSIHQFSEEKTTVNTLLAQVQVHQQEALRWKLECEKAYESYLVEFENACNQEAVLRIALEDANEQRRLGRLDNQALEGRLREETARMAVIMKTVQSRDNALMIDLRKYFDELGEDARHVCTVVVQEHLQNRHSQTLAAFCEASGLPVTDLETFREHMNFIHDVSSKIHSILESLSMALHIPHPPTKESVEIQPSDTKATISFCCATAEYILEYMLTQVPTLYLSVESAIPWEELQELKELADVHVSRLKKGFVDVDDASLIASAVGRALMKCKK